MKKFTILFLLFFSFYQAGCFSQSTQTIENLNNVQQAEDPYTYDFGKVKEGEVLRHSFLLKNSSAKTLHIGDVNTSCGCTVSNIDKKILGPDESASIGVEFNTKGYSGLTQQYVYVHTDSLDKPIIKYIIKAEVVK